MESSDLIFTLNKTNKNKTKLIMSNTLLKKQINEAKQYGNKEIEKFNNATKLFFDEIEDLALFSDQIPSLESDILSLSSVIEDILKGNNLYDLSDIEFVETRKGLYKKLINKYINKK